VISGLSFTLLSVPTTNETVNLTLASDSSQLSNALQTLTTSYNALVDQVAQQVGPGAGPLAGDMAIREISDDMRQLSGYWANSTTIHSLSDVGVTFDTTGHMSFDSSVVSSLSNTQVSDAFKFFSSSNSGFGALASNFKQLTDPLSGDMILEENGLDTANTQLTNQISVLNERASQLEASMTTQLQQADALVAQLQSEQNLVNASIESVNYVNFGRLVNSAGQ